MEYFKEISKSLLKWVQCECISKLFGFQLGKVTTALEEVLMAPSFENYLSKTKLNLIRGYVSTITYTLQNVATISHHSGNSNQRACPEQIIIRNSLF
jgi:hypothetical protein